VDRDALLAGKNGAASKRGKIRLQRRGNRRVQRQCTVQRRRAPRVPRGHTTGAAMHGRDADLARQKSAPLLQRRDRPALSNSHQARSCHGVA
jgi:hypothetical protein